jgi:hypothetical protein
VFPRNYQPLNNYIRRLIKYSLSVSDACLKFVVALTDPGSKWLYLMFRMLYRICFAGARADNKKKCVRILAISPDDPIKIHGPKIAVTNSLSLSISGSFLPWLVLVRHEVPGDVLQAEMGQHNTEQLSQHRRDSPFL